MKVQMIIPCYGAYWDLHYGDQLFILASQLETIEIYNCGKGDRDIGMRGVCNHWRKI